MEIEEIHNSLINGQRKQMAEQINDYGLYDFWGDYKDYLNMVYMNTDSALYYFADCVISYHRIMKR